MRNLLLSGGVAHPFAETAPLVADILTDVGIESVVHLDMAEGLARLERETFDLVTVQGLRWSMTQHEKYAPLRDQWAYAIPQAARDALVGHAQNGGGILGLHGASLCFDDWTQWGDHLGAVWQWGKSHHPAYGEIKVHFDDARHPATRDLIDFTTPDELYSDLVLSPDVTVLAHGIATTGTWQPLVTAREGAGRAIYIGLGHDVASLRAPMHRQLLRQSAAWCLRLT